LCQEFFIITPLYARMVKLNWSKGKNLGLALIFLGIIGLTQVIFITIAQYGLSIGSPYFVIFIPLGVTLALFYGVITIFESSTSMAKYRGARQFSTKNTKNSAPFLQSQQWTILRPIIIIIISFSVVFLFTYLIADYWLEAGNSFIIAENLGAILALVVATYIETAQARKMR